MARFLYNIGRRIIISKRNRSVRRGIVFLLTNLLMLAGFVFALEIILILMGIGDVFIPMTHKALSFLTRLVF